MIGTRVYPNSEGEFDFSESGLLTWIPGSYGCDKDGFWVCRPPRGRIGALEQHQVTEHEDGTITVSPSIVCDDDWHGWLERGVWREV